ncbi:mitochondrial 39-S ribosomal protein L47 (MRP-L47)-domain-containing protein [Kalaharituber pfeilii]|nr:mitochondrial 39-S ribosomal protein L47 (MRP-L47)-domain-containing protein [Kalaharituber pfeilii]
MSALQCLNPAARLLLPARCIYSPSVSSYLLTAGFHNSAPLAAHKTQDRSKNRGVSAIHRKYPKQPLSVAKVALPQPADVVDTRIDIDPDHGLYGFFKAKDTVLPTPEDDHKHGRAWSVEELRRKSWEDLHKLWWTCVKERNIMFTQQLERKRLDPGFGAFEAKSREREIARTQRAIKHVLTERYYAWQEALMLAKSDLEINMTGNGPVYKPRALEESTPDLPDEVSELPKGASEGKATASG